MLTSTPAPNGSEIRMQQTTEPAPFRSVEAALRFAYRMEGQSIVKISSYFKGLRGSTVRGKRRFDGPWDDHAQAAMILVMVERTLTPPQFICIRCYYTHPSESLLEMRKQTDYRLLGELYRQETKDPIDQWFVTDVVRGWAGDRRHKDDTQWAAHLKMHPKSIQARVVGRRERNKIGIIPFLNELQSGATNALYTSMVDGGLIE